MDMISTDILRIIDANLNRMGEGLRVLEEFARFSINDNTLTQQLKDMRHDILTIDAQLQERLVGARDSESDVGADMDVSWVEKERDSRSILAANSRRVQESLRVMEELSKTPDIGLESDKYRKARFTLYTVEKELLSKILRRDKIIRLKGLYIIIDTAFLKGRKHIEVAEQAIRGGAKVIQLRDKETNKNELTALAREMQELCSKHEVLFIVNDYLDVALAADADGLHVGSEDLPVSVARRLLPIDKILGASARTADEAKAAYTDGADYLGIGAIYATSTKEPSEVVGTKRLKELRKKINPPLVAIGGINKDNVTEVLKAGADAIAVINAVMGAENIESATREISDIIEGVQGG